MGGTFMKKKGIGLLVILSIVFLLAACGSKEVEKRVFELEEMGIVTTMTYTYQGDEVLKQKAENIFPYASLGVSSQEEAEEILDPQVEELQGIDGVTEEIEYKEDEALEVLEIDYENLDPEKIEKIPGLNISGNIKNGISMEKSAEALLSQGYEEVE